MVGNCMCDAGEKLGGMCCAAVQCRPSSTQSWWQFVASQESTQVQVSLVVTHVEVQSGGENKVLSTAQAI